jgi:hypothetical protein
MKHNAYPLMTRFSKITAVVALLCTSLLGFASNLDGQTYSSSHLSISVMISDDHVVWVGTHGQGLLRFKKEGGVQTFLLPPILDLLMIIFRGLHSIPRGQF